MKGRRILPKLYDYRDHPKRFLMTCPRCDSALIRRGWEADEPYCVICGWADYRQPDRRAEHLAMTARAQEQYKKLTSYRPQNGFPRNGRPSKWA